MNTQTKHTPGPWHTPREVFNPMKHGHNPATYRAIAIGNGACHVGFATVSNCIGAQEADANAQLIAQAPDLLRQRDRLREALKEAVYEIRFALDNENAQGSRLEAAETNARAILAETEAKP